MNAFTILVQGKNRANEAFESVERGMHRLSRRARQLGNLFKGGFAVAAMKRAYDAIMATTTRADELAESGNRAKSAWRDFFSVFADGFASAQVKMDGWSETVAKKAAFLRDEARRAVAAATGSAVGLDPETARRNAEEDIDLLNAEQKARRWNQDKGVQALEKKRAELAEKAASPTERLADATAKLAAEEKKLSGMDQYDLNRVGSLNKILELQGKITAAMKDQAAEAKRLAEEEAARTADIIATEQASLDANKEALKAEQDAIGASPSARREARQQRKAAEKEARKAQNRIDVALRNAERDPTRAYREQLRQQLQRSGRRIGEAGALLNEGEDSNIPRNMRRGVAVRDLKLLGAAEAVAAGEAVVAGLKNGAGQANLEGLQGTANGHLANIENSLKFLNGFMKPA